MAQLYFYYSAMNAGKSTALLQSAHNYREQGMEVMLFTAAIDDRFGGKKISSRIGLATPALTFDATTDFLALTESALSQPHSTQINAAQSEAGDTKPIACILVDEAQFLTREQVDQLARIVDQINIPVLCYGIRTDFQGELFAGSMRLLAIADKLKELKTVCSCGRKATMTIRLDDSGQPISAGNQVVIGGNDRYESKCRRHYYELLADTQA